MLSYRPNLEELVLKTLDLSVIDQAGKCIKKSGALSLSTLTEEPAGGLKGSLPVLDLLCSPQRHWPHGFCFHAFSGDPRGGTRWS